MPHDQTPARSTYTCVELDDVVILNGKRHCLPITKEQNYVLSEFKDVFKGIAARGQVPYSA